MATVNRAFRVKNGLNVEGAELRPAAGTTSYPPILLTSGTNLTTATAGAFEYDGTNFYLTASTGGRKTIAFTDMAVSAATSSALGTIKLGSDTQNTATAASVGSTNGRTYLTQFNASQQLVVNVPWTDTVYTLPAATATTLGGIELFSGTTQTTAANSVTTTASRTYGLQINSDGQGVINVPWTDTDTNTFPTTWTWTDGTTAGPTAAITGTSSTITVAATPSASATVSGIVTTGAQTFAGVKTLTSPAITTSLTTGSTSFDLLDTTATTVNFARAGTAITIGATSGTTTVRNNLTVTGDLTVNGTTTTINSTVVNVDDILVELGAVASPTDTTANGGGISVLSGTGNKTFTWASTGANWTSSENLSLATGKTFKINNVDVLSATALGSSVVGSSLTSVGTIATGTWNGTIIGGQWGGTGVNNSGRTITIGGNFTTSGAHTTTLTTTGNTSITLPTSGTVVANPVSVTGAGTAVSLTGGATTGTSLEVGGAVNITGGASTAGSAENTGGAVVITGGAANTSAGSGGSVTINGGLGNSASLGEISIGTLNTSRVTVGATGSNIVAPRPVVIGGTSGASIVTSAGSTTGTTALTLTSLYSSSFFDGGEFVIKATNSTNVEILKVLIITNGTDTYMTTYGDVWVTSDLVSVDFSYSGALVNMVITPVAGTTGTTTVKVTGTLLAK
jgi:hypothetical protein